MDVCISGVAGFIGGVATGSLLIGVRADADVEKIARQLISITATHISSGITQTVEPKLVYASKGPAGFHLAIYAYLFKFEWGDWALAYLEIMKTPSVSEYAVHIHSSTGDTFSPLTVTLTDIQGSHVISVPPKGSYMARHQFF